MTTSMQDLKFLQAICLSAIDGVVIADAAGGIVLANPAALAMLGYQANELTVWTVDELLFPAANGKGQILHRSGTGKRAVIVGEKSKTLLRKKDGTVFPARLVITQLIENKPYYACIIHDLSDHQKDKAPDLQPGKLAARLKAMEKSKEEFRITLVKEQESGRMKSRFVALASHEFRTPLSSIQLSASLIEHYFDRLDKEKIFRHLHKISLAVADMTGTLNDLLSLEKIESGHMAVQYQQVDPAEFCRVTAEQMGSHLKDGQKILQQHRQPGKLVITDSKLLRHCLANLLSNALKYSPENSRITLASGISRNHYWLQVSDHGIGIPQAGQEHLFEPFFRAENVADIPGTGLGLSIVKKCADLLKGSVTCKSREGRGTSFKLRFPLIKPSLPNMANVPVDKK